MTSRQAKPQEDTYFRAMRILQDNPDLTQSKLTEKPGISVGGLNYFLRALMEKGLVKIKTLLIREISLDMCMPLQVVWQKRLLSLTASLN